MFERQKSYDCAMPILATGKKVSMTIFDGSKPPASSNSAATSCAGTDTVVLLSLPVVPASVNKKSPGDVPLTSNAKPRSADASKAF